jgi:hypothetical protein
VVRPLPTMKETPVPKRTKKTSARKTVKAVAYTISAPNPYYEGFYYDNKLRFIDGKAKVTDALARTVKMRDGVSHDEYVFEDAEEMARHFMDTIGNNFDDQGKPTERSYKITPELPYLEPVIDDLTPNAGRPRRGRRRPGEVVRAPIVPSPAGLPAGADDDAVGRTAQGQRTKKNRELAHVAS